MSLLAGTDLRAAGTLLAGSDVRIDARNIDTREIAAAGTLTITAGESLTASGGLQAGPDARLEALSVATDEVLAGSRFTAAGRLQAAADVLIEADNVSTAAMRAHALLGLMAFGRETDLPLVLAGLRQVPLYDFLHERARLDVPIWSPVALVRL